MKIIQRCDSWGTVEHKVLSNGCYSVAVYFDRREDAEAFKVELMMVASGQQGYEKPADIKFAGEESR